LKFIRSVIADLQPKHQDNPMTDTDPAPPDDPSDVAETEAPPVDPSTQPPGARPVPEPDPAAMAEPVYGIDAGAEEEAEAGEETEEEA
jgi:hypothetical protein